MVLNDAVSVPSSSKPSTPVHDTQQALHEFSPSPEQKGISTSLVKGPSSRIRLNHPSSNILESLNDNMRLRSKALSVITHSCYLSQFEPKKIDEVLHAWSLPSQHLKELRLPFSVRIGTDSMSK